MNARSVLLLLAAAVASGVYLAGRVLLREWDDNIREALRAMNWEPT